MEGHSYKSKDRSVEYHGEVSSTMQEYPEVRDQGLQEFSDQVRHIVVRRGVARWWYCHRGSAVNQVVGHLAQAMLRT